jgi:fimbrial isopeptide formation D2 family protein
MKKILALVLALAMILMVGAVYAEGENSLPTAEISITNMVVDDEVSLYKIIKWNPNKLDANNKVSPDWDFNGITVNGYATVEALVAALQGNDASTAMTALAAAVGQSQLVETTTLTSTTYAKTVEVGSYLALVKGADGYTYNPMVLSVNFADPTTGDGGTINADTAVTGTTIVAKKQPVTIEKDVNDTDKMHDIAVGDTIPFIVSTVTPNYGENYTSPVFIITDTLSTGIAMTEAQQAAIVVKNNGTALTAGNDKDYTITTSASGYTITFTEKYLHSVKANTNVTVEYSATVNEKAVMHNVEQYDNDLTSSSPTAPALLMIASMMRLITTPSLSTPACWVAKAAKTSLRNL